MTNSDFLQILENFPGLTSLRNQEKKELIFVFSFLDFDKIFREITFDLTIPSEELWFKFLSFWAIGCEILAQKKDEEFWPKCHFSSKTEREAKIIVSSFNSYFKNNSIIKVTGITLDELISFAESGWPLF